MVSQNKLPKGTYIVFVIVVLGLTIGCTSDDFSSPDWSADMSAKGFGPDLLQDQGPDMPVKKSFGKPCKDSAQCGSSICVKTCKGSLCSKKCTPGPSTGCPAGSGCIGVNGAIEPGKVDYVCIEVCDSGVPDLPTVDRTVLDKHMPDQALADMTQPDRSHPDKAIPDQIVPDLILSDQAVPDQAIADFSVPDLDVPDQVVPDLHIPDLMVPDKTQPDFGVCNPTGWATIMPGTYKMGSPTSEPCRETNVGIKETQHTVTLTHMFEAATKEVSQCQYGAAVGAYPSSSAGCGMNCPVEKVSWHMAVHYCNQLSLQKKVARCYTCAGSGASTSCQDKAAYAGDKIYKCKGYRLPTEAEWEYLYRAGTTTAFYNGPINSVVCNTTNADANASKIGWYWANSGQKPHLGGKKKPNAWGLYDMAGNVNEWCHDWFTGNLGSASKVNPVGPASGTEKVIRGGSWKNISKHMRAANRIKHPIGQRSPWVGFRCVRTLRWEKLVSNTTTDLWDVWGINSGDAFAVGLKGTIMHFNGTTWSKQNSGTTRKLNAVWGSAGNNVLAVGEVDTSTNPHKTTLLRYNGQAWKHVATPVPANLFSLRGSSAGNIWAGGDGGRVFRSIGGAWANVNAGGSFVFYSIFPLNASATWAAGGAGKMMHWNGASWAAQATGVSLKQNFYGLWGTATNNIYAIGGNDARLMRFDGSKWSTVLGGGTLYGIHGNKANNIFVTGPAGTVLHYDGTSWTKEKVPTKQHLYGIWVAPGGGTVFAVGTKGVILRRQ